MHALVLGGGYAGLLVTRKLQARLPEEADLTIVDDTGEHLVQHELHRAIRDPGYVDDIAVPLTELLDRATVVQAEVTDVDRQAREVSLADGDVLTYDVAAVTLGAETAFYGIPGLEEHATPLKRLDHAARIRRQFLDVLDSGGGTVVVGGAGLSGIQTAGELATMAEEEGAGEQTRIVLLEQEATIAPGFPEEFRRAARHELDDIGVDVHTGVTVTAADEDAVDLDGAGPDCLPYDQLIWTGGIRGPAALAGDRPQVRGDLRLDERTFGLGDAVRIVDADGEPVPAAAQAAVRATETAAHNMVEVLDSDGSGAFADIRQWRFDSPGWLISVGDSAVAQIGPEVVTGPLANLVKSSVGVTYLAEHGSLGRALTILREEVDAAGDLKAVLRHKR